MDVSQDRFVFDTGSRPATPPSPRNHVNLAFDIESDRSITFGGSKTSVVSMVGAFALDLSANAWTKLKDGPKSHGGSSMVYDSKADRMIVFGGFSITTYLATNDIWEYDFATNTWTEVIPSP